MSTTELDASYAAEECFEELPELKLPILTDIIEEDVLPVSDKLHTHELTGELHSLHQAPNDTGNQVSDHTMLDFSVLPSLNLDELGELDQELYPEQSVFNEAVNRAEANLADHTRSLTDRPEVAIKGASIAHTEQSIGGMPNPSILPIASTLADKEMANELSAVPLAEQATPVSPTDTVTHVTQPVAIIHVATGVGPAAATANPTIASPLPIALFNDKVLVEALYQTVLPRMKTEVSTWLQKSLAQHVQRMTAEVLDQFEQECQQWFNVTLRDTIKQTIDNLRQEEPEVSRAG